jgi:hypothetical protein
VDLGSKVARMVADEEPAIVRDVGIDDRPAVSWSKYLIAS